MNKAITLIWTVIAIAVIAVIAYVLYQLIALGKKFGDINFNPLKAVGTPGATAGTGTGIYSSPFAGTGIPFLDPNTRPDARTASVGANALDRRGANFGVPPANSADLHWWQKNPLDTIEGWFAPTTSIKTPQTVGSGAGQVNAPPGAISLLTPSNQPGQTPLGMTTTTGLSGGTLDGNTVAIGALPSMGPNAINTVTFPPLANDPTVVPVIQANRPPTPVPSDIDTSQLQFIGQ